MCNSGLFSALFFILFKWTKLQAILYSLISDNDISKSHCIDINKYFDSIGIQTEQDFTQTTASVQGLTLRLTLLTWFNFNYVAVHPLYISIPVRVCEF